MPVKCQSNATQVTVSTELVARGGERFVVLVLNVKWTAGRATSQPHNTSTPVTAPVPAHHTTPTPPLASTSCPTAHTPHPAPTPTPLRKHQKSSTVACCVTNSPPKTQGQTPQCGRTAAPQRRAPQPRAQPGPRALRQPCRRRQRRRCRLPPAVRCSPTA